MTTTCAIVPTFNRADYIGECLDSLLNQTRPVDQIIVVDDGSSDNTAEIIAAYGDKVTYIQKENGGKSSALNLGLKHCVCDYVWICDDDDYAALDAHEKMANALDEHSDVDFACGRHQVFQDVEHGREISDAHYTRRSEEPSMKICYMESLFSYQYAMLVRKSLYDKIGPFNEDLIRSQDFEMCIRMTRENKGIELPDVMFHQRRHDGAHGTAENPITKEQKLEKWFENDRKIFSRIYAEYDLSEFEPSFAKEFDPNHKKRAALIQRAAIIVYRDMWPQAAADLVEASKAFTGPLTPQEKHLLEIRFEWPSVWDRLLKSPDVQEALRKLYQSGPVGAEIVLSMTRPLIWHIRQSTKSGNYKNVQNRIALMMSVLGLTGTFKRFYVSFAKK